MRQLSLPSGTIHLRTGQNLRVIDADYRPLRGMRGRRWRARDGLTVVATLNAVAGGECLHVSLSYSKRMPPAEVIEAVAAAFFPEDVRVALRFPGPGDMHPYMVQLIQAEGLLSTPEVLNWGYDGEKENGQPRNGWPFPAGAASGGRSRRPVAPATLQIR